MKFRYVIEKVYDEVIPDAVVLSEATPSDSSYRLGSSPMTVAEAQELAQTSARSFDPEVVLNWKDAPTSWDDVVAVSQYLDDGVEEARDS